MGHAESVPPTPAMAFDDISFCARSKVSTIALCGALEAASHKTIKTSSRGAGSSKLERGGKILFRARGWGLWQLIEIRG